MTKTKLRSAYVPHERVTFDGLLLNHKTGEFFKPVTRVKQSHVAECDINNILKDYSKTGQLKHISAKAAIGAYRDLPDDVDFQAAQNIVAKANEAFATLPSKVRDRFQNDPQEFLEFMADPENHLEAVRLGLMTRSEVPPPAESGGAGGKIPPAASGTLAPPPEPEGSRNAPEGKK